MTQLIILGLCVAVAFAANPTDITVDENASCGTTTTLQLEDEVRLFCNGDAPGTSCQFTFNGEPDGKCAGVCYMFDLYPFIKDPEVSLMVNSGSYSMTYDSTTGKFPSNPICTEKADPVVFTISEEAGYTFNPKKAEDAYRYRLSVFNFCGSKGQVKNQKFEEVIEHVHGYHHGEEKDDREKSQFITGILLGFGLSCIFLVVLLIAYCYTRNSPNRGPNRSVGMPKVGGFKKKMKTNTSHTPKNETVGVRYQPTDPDNKPEVEPMLKSGAYDPEKPPLDTAISVDECDETTEPSKDEKPKDNNAAEKTTTPDCTPASDSTPAPDCKPTHDSTPAPTYDSTPAPTYDSTPAPTYSTPDTTTSYSGGGGGGGYSSYSGGDSGGGGGGSSCGGGGGDSGGGGGGSCDD